MGTSTKNIGVGFGKSSNFWPAHAQTGSGARSSGKGVIPEVAEAARSARIHRATGLIRDPQRRVNTVGKPVAATYGGPREGRPTEQKPCRPPRGPRRAARTRRGIFGLRAIEDGLARSASNGPQGRVRRGEVASHGATLGMGRDRRADVDARRHQPRRDARFVRAGSCARLGKPVAPRAAGTAVINRISPAHPRQRPARRHSEAGRRPP